MPDATFANFRDLGGLALRGGGWTRAGVVFRCSAPVPGDELPIALQNSAFSVIDLRGRNERPQYDWPTNVTVRRHTLYDAADLNHLGSVDLVDVYRDMLRSAANRITAAVAMVDNDEPTVIHCTAGKDRTGVVAAVLLLLAGAEPESIVADYRATEAEMASVIERLVAAGTVDRRRVTPLWYSAPKEAVSVVLNELVSHPAGPEGWFAENGGDVDVVRSLRQRLRHEGPGPRP